MGLTGCVHIVKVGFTRQIVQTICWNTGLTILKNERQFLWIFLVGLRMVLQTSFFYETGSVSDDVSLLHEKMKSSFGVGFRAIISGLIYRFDMAKGEDGIAPTLFINYPLSIGSLGN